MELTKIESPSFAQDKTISLPVSYVQNLDANFNSKLYEDFYNDMNPQKKFNNPDSEDFDNSDFYNLYYLDKNQSKEDTDKILDVSNQFSKNNKDKIFEFTKVMKEEKRIGRKRKGDNHQYKEKVHTKYDKDNIHTKIQVHFLKFLFCFINEIIEIYFGKKKQFLNIDYQNKKVVTKDNVKKLKTTKIGEILSQDISTKYKKLNTIDKEINNKLYLEVIENENIKKILSETYINIFRNLYYKNKRNLNNYGLKYYII